MNIIVNVSDARISRDPADTLATYSLGSCIAVGVYDSTAGVGGLLHFQLPTAQIDTERARQNPLMFADTGLAVLLNEVERLGGSRRRLKIRLAGAAQMLNDNRMFNIGRRNHAAIRKLLWQQGLFVDSEEIGGSSPRNMYVRIADGSITVKTLGQTTNS